jgi:hypothetical protein
MEKIFATYSSGKGLIFRLYKESKNSWVAIHMYMETTVGISLYSYLYLKLAKPLCISYYLLCFSSIKSDTRGQNRFCLVGSGGSGPNNVNTYE